MIVPTGGSGATYNKATQASVGSAAALKCVLQRVAVPAAVRRGGGAKPATQQSVHGST